MARPVNYRDVGEVLRRWDPTSPIKPGALLRGGRFDEETMLEEIGGARTIVNLRPKKDPKHLVEVRIVHVPTNDSVETYDFRSRTTAKWATKVLKVLADDQAEVPVYIHCTSGKDRTGVVVALVLHVLGVQRDLILREYGESAGVEARDLASALDGFGSLVIAERAERALRAKFS